MFDYRLVNSSKEVGDQDVDNIESKIGCRFPDSLREFYLKFNGGEVEGGRKIFESEDGMEFEVKTFLPILYQRFSGDSLLESSYDLFVREKKLIPEGYIPFAMDSGGFRFCMFCENGSVYFNNLDNLETSDDVMQYVAPSIGDFINNMLTEDEAFDD